MSYETAYLVILLGMFLNSNDFWAYNNTFDESEQDEDRDEELKGNEEGGIERLMPDVQYEIRLRNHDVIERPREIHGFKDKSLENFPISPCGQYIAFVGNN
ncbi:22287_t:CDS:2 [Entrophospora sp. SA101]|nr:22287_t:CDS:2 [Entrophospora sp. SA101]